MVSRGGAVRGGASLTLLSAEHSRLLPLPLPVPVLVPVPVCLWLWLMYLHSGYLQAGRVPLLPVVLIKLHNARALPGLAWPGLVLPCLTPKILSRSSRTVY